MIARYEDSESAAKDNENTTKGGQRHNERRNDGYRDSYSSALHQWQATVSNAGRHVAVARIGTKGVDGYAGVSRAACREGDKVERWYGTRCRYVFDRDAVVVPALQRDERRQARSEGRTRIRREKGQQLAEHLFFCSAARIGTKGADRYAGMSRAARREGDKVGWGREVLYASHDEDTQGPRVVGNHWRDVNLEIWSG
ncbi:hypothetical protein BD410DRAFT_803442 [Rickenella mellea]|uniref:Uncharacterized protein n=1 Tax=Rickenella mellea TaxID=50990 RepID=A0A4Y7Q3W0_9AGAM|nr:hypothetical protein BD410DRAFT_803442 [Rickenella mellea]